jgi:uncharacterized protein (TIGR03118 family)
MGSSKIRFFRSVTRRSGSLTSTANFMFSYAQQDGNAEDDVKGAGHGFIDIFTTDGFFVRRFASRGFRNSPWGLAIAPADFGIASGKLLVGNQGNGHIAVFDPATGLPLVSF